MPLVPRQFSGRQYNGRLVTAKEKVLEHAPNWSEAQAERALLAAESGRPGKKRNGAGERGTLAERAAAFRARQTEVVDAVELVREGRGELERRGS